MKEYGKKKKPIGMQHIKTGLVKVLFLAGVLFIGAALSFLTAGIKGIHFGFYLWPFAACVSLFAFTATGFFMTEGKTELLFGTCSIASAVCIIVQLAILS